jgi:predicted RecA/RadA family phage recombinase
VDAGEVIVLGDTVFVAKRDIPANTLGALATTGVFDFPKGAGEITMGTLIFWDPDADSGNGQVTLTAEDNYAIGPAIATAASAATHVRALLRASIINEES